MTAHRTSADHLDPPSEGHLMTTLTAPVSTDPATTAPELQAGRRLDLRSTLDDARALPEVLRSDRIKLLSLRSNRAVLGLTAVIGGFSSWAVATLVTDEVLTVAEVFVYSTFLTAVLAAVAGLLLFTSEVQHGTLAAVLTAQPARWLVTASKTLVAAIFGLVLGATGMATGYIGAVLAGLESGDTSQTLSTSLWALLFTSLAAVLGLGVGMIVRHSSAGLSGLLVWWLVVENLLWAFLPAEVSRFLPFYAGGALLGVEVDTHTPETLAVAFSRPENALVFAAVAALALATGTALLHRRDTD
jgi:ABC-2 type transport system permease protein